MFQLGTKQENLTLVVNGNLSSSNDFTHRKLGLKRYELSNHLGNVMQVISDRKLPHGDGTDIAYYEAEVISYSDYYPFGMLMPNRYGSPPDGYRYGFNGMESDDEVRGTKGASYDFGARMLDPRIGRWLSVDPHEAKYPSMSPYIFVGNMPIVAIDPDGRDIIILSDNNAANKQGHAAILIGDNKNGWTYISKDGFTGSALGSDSKYVVMKFTSIEEFRNSVNNFEVNETHGTTEGNENENLTFKLDENGNKIQRYDEAIYFGATQKDGTSTDEKTIKAATESAESIYCLTDGDCSDVVGDGLLVSKDSEGKQIKNGNTVKTGDLVIDLYNKRPRTKFEKIKNRNKSDVNYDEGIKPDDLSLQEGETGK